MLDSYCPPASIRLLSCLVAIQAVAFGQQLATVTLTASPNPATYGQPLSLTVSVTSGATGKVTFYDGVSVLGTATISGTQAKLTSRSLSSGSRSLWAHYSGDTTFAPSNSASVPQTVLAGTSLGFRNPVGYSTGIAPDVVAVADFDRDGAADLVIANRYASTVSVLLGNGNGTFQSKADFSTGMGPQCLAVGDFNTDGNPDIAVGTAYGSATQIAILMGDGSGTFQPPVTYALVNTPKRIALADFNLDGIIDLVVVTGGFGAPVSVLAGNVDGSFRAPVYYNSPPTVQPLDVIVADFNGDRKPDFAVVTSIGVTVYLGKGDGGFQDPVNQSLSPTDTFSSASAAAGDFNGDGISDLAIVVPSYGKTFILLGHGDATFATPVPFDVDSGSTSAVVEDYNGDGRLDLAVAQSTDSVQILLGNGNGTFQPRIKYALQGGGYGLAVGDFNGDGIPDLTETEQTSNAEGVAVLLGGAVPDISVAISHSGAFTQGQTGAAYTLDVSNTGDVGSVGAVSLNATIPSGFTATAISGSGWTCLLATLTCTRSDSVGPHGAYPAVTIMVNVPGAITGDFTATASVAGGSDQNPANNTATDTILVRTSTATTLAASPNPAVLGQSVTLTATVSPTASGKVTFYDGAAVIGVSTLSGGQANISTSLLPSGSRTLRATYGGDSTYGPSISSPRTQTISVMPANGFLPYTPYQLPATPQALGIGDLNLDGIPDLVTTSGSTAPAMISVLLGRNDGAFSQPLTSNVTGASGLSSLAIADFDGDGKPDIAASGGGSIGIHILLGNGDGSFQAAMMYGKPAESYANIIVGDFNGDGRLDLAALGYAGPVILIGNGDGTFQAPIAAATPLYLNAFAVTDLNNDGKADLIGLTSSVVVMLGNGDGTFQAPVSYSDPGFSNPLTLTVGDFDRDGRPDVAVIYIANVGVFAGSGDGTLRPPVNSSLSSTPGYKAVAGDLNGDGNLDIAYSGSSPNEFSIAFGNGDGTFQCPGYGLGTALRTDAALLAMVAADFNGDGRLDLAVANSGTGDTATVDVFLGGQFSGLNLSVSHNGNFIAGQTGTYQISVRNPAFVKASGITTVTEMLPAGMTATAIAGSGWNCTLSTVVCNRQDDLTSDKAFPSIIVTVSVASNLGPGALTNQVSVTNGGATNSASDVTQIVGGTTTGLEAAPNPSILSQPVTLTATVSAGGTGAVAFYDGGAVLGTAMLSNGRAGLVTTQLAAVTHSLVAMYPGDAAHGPSRSAPFYETVAANPASGLRVGATLPTGTGPSAIAAADLNLDGKTDLVTANYSANTLSVLLGDGSGGFASKVDYSVGTAPGALVIADFNNDGKPDIATVNHESNDLSVLLGRGDGTFQTAVSYATGHFPNALLAADFNGTGNVDLIVANGGDSMLTLFSGNGDGTFRTPKPISTASVWIPAVGDFNGDGKPDIAAGPYGVWIFLGNGDGTFLPQTVAAGGGLYAMSLAIGDLNGDRKADIVAVDSGAGVYVLLGNGDGTFRSPVLYGCSFSPGKAILADVNGDGNLDVLTINSTSTISIFFGKGDGTLRPALSYILGSARAAAAGDFNGDGRTDLAISQDSSVTILPGVLTPLLSVTGSHSGSFYLGQIDAAYTIVVTNFGPGATSGNVSVADTLPPELTATSMAGSGWTCVLATLTCTRNDSLAAGSTYPPIVLTVNVSANAPPSVSNLVSVSGNGSPPIVTSDAIAITPSAALRFVPVTPCRVADTRKPDGPFGGPQISGGTFRSFAISNSTCGMPATAQAYSLNVAVVPAGPLGYLTLWPTGKSQPVASTLNSLDGRIKSNAAIVPAGTGGAINVFASNTTDVVIDVNGYFVPATDPTALAFFPVTPCRVADTRKPAAPLAGPSLLGGQHRSFPILSSTCNIPATAQAYSLNLTAVPPAPLGYITAWPTGQTQPLASSLNATTGTVTANAALLPAGTGGSIDVVASNNTDLVIDINGYFAPMSTGGLSLYNVIPCRVLDTRKPAGSGPFSGNLNVNATANSCGIPVGSQAYVLNVTVVPPAALGYLTLWPQGATQPVASTLNALDAAITSNLALVPATNGSISAFPSNPTHLVLDIFGFFGQ